MPWWVQWLGPSTRTAGGHGSIPGWRTKDPISHAAWPKQKIKTLTKKNKERERAQIKLTETENRLMVPRAGDEGE